jgi:dipeptidyl aminopeptidase B
MDHLYNGTFYAQHKSLHWVPEGVCILVPYTIWTDFGVAGDGVFSFQSEGWIKLVDLKTNTTTNLVYQHDVKDVGAIFHSTLALD